MAILVIGLLPLWLVPRAVDGAAETLHLRPWATSGLELLGYVGSWSSSC